MASDLGHSLDSALDQARRGTLELAELFTVAEGLVNAGRPEQAMDLYRLWLESTSSPWAFMALYNLAAILGNSGRLAEAEQGYRQAIGLKPDFVQAYLNLGSLLERAGREEEALECWRLVLSFPVPVDKAFQLHALNNLGRLLEIMHRLAEAEAMLERSLRLEPNQDGVIQHWVHLRQKQCKWPIYAELDGLTEADMLRASSPLTLLAFSGDPAVQLSAARRFVQEKVDTRLPALGDPQGYGHDKLRIGYLSSNFSIHAVSLLTVELYELHDRSRVEVYAFCWSGEDKTYMRSRIAGAVDRYIRIGDLGDEEAARCIRSHEIDILVDLQGITSGARPNILGFRPAPVQITYLGFPGTTGMPFIDYVLADRFLIPEELWPYFTEKPLYMPHSFQISDRGRQAGPRPTRAACGLPEDAFVFCSFNNNYKFTPEMFATWMRILARVPDSILWLLADNEWARESLIQAAARHGIDSHRLIFAPRVTPPDYLARYQAADLFLDTYPFNAGTTANDALWMGLPLLTYSGRTFASRMAGSLLTALGLPELITGSLEAYEEKAVELGNDRAKVAWLKSYLSDSRQTGKLFDIPGFVRDLEDVYESVAVRGSKGEETAVGNTVDSSRYSVSGNRDLTLYRVVYSPEGLAELESGYSVLDNLAQDRLDWQEYWPIRKFLLTASLDENRFYGFLPHDFRKRTSLSFEDAAGFVGSVDPSTDVVIFGHQPDIGALFKNVFESKLILDHEYMAVSQKVFDLIGYAVDLDRLVMDSRSIVFNGCFAAKPRFWRVWFDMTEKLFALAEDSVHGAELQAEFVDPAAYSGVIQRKALLIESVASLLLSTQKRWKTATGNPFGAAWSRQFAHAMKEAVISDALKIAFNDRGFPEYIGAYNRIREEVFKPRLL
jgi:predicted O-linked N-acetylglucosamine transferase (SPINDLY family)